MINLIRNEFIKLFANRKIHAFLAVIFIIEVIPVLLSLFSVYKIEDGQTFPLFFFGITSALILPIFLTIIISEMITEEYLIGTLSLSLIHPVSRYKMIGAKTLTIFLTILLSLTYTMLLAYLIGTLLFGWGDVFLNKGITYTASEGVLLTIGTYLVSAFPLLAYSMVIMFFSLIFNSSAVVVGAALGLLITTTFAGYLVTEIQPYLINSYLNNFSYSLMFSKDTTFLLMGLKVIAFYGIFFYLINSIILKKRDLVY